MRKLLIVLMIVMLTLSMAACNNEDSAGITNPELPTRPTYENADEYTLIFTNEGMSLDLTWDRLSAAIQGKHKDATMMSEAIKANKEYFSTLIKVDLPDFFEKRAKSGLEIYIKKIGLDKTNLILAPSAFLSL